MDDVSQPRPLQPSLFDDADHGRHAAELPITIGHAQVSDSPSRSILTKASGFMSSYDYTLNPYAGCSYGCSYCYAAFFARDVAKQNTWGQWVEAKTSALDIIRRMRTDLRGRTVYMSSVTDPYQPIERRLGLVRELLPELADRGVHLVIQTRSPLVVRDIDLLKRFEQVRVNMTVTTDSREVQQAFEPHCPTNRRRLDAARRLVDAGVVTHITMTPLLPVADADAFAAQVAATGAAHFVVQPFHATRGRFVAGTGQRAREILSRLGWDDAAYRRTVASLRAALPSLDEGRDGFAPDVG
jgi:DNA repair photolyase